MRGLSFYCSIAMRPPLDQSECPLVLQQDISCPEVHDSLRDTGEPESAYHDNLDCADCTIGLKVGTRTDDHDKRAEQEPRSPSKEQAIGVTFLTPVPGQVTASGVTRAASSQPSVSRLRVDALDGRTGFMPIALAGSCVFAAAASAASRPRGKARGRGRLEVLVSCAAAPADVKERKKKEKKPFSRATQVVESLFTDGGRKADFARNAWYESPDESVTSQKRVWTYWDTSRPTREIEKICDGKQGCGVTWRQLDGVRGVSYFRFTSEGQVSFVREIPEPSAKSGGNTMASLSGLFGVMGGIKDFFNSFDQVLQVEDKNLEAPTPKRGLAAPKTRRAEDVVIYLWEEAQYNPTEPVEKMVAEYAEDAVVEELTVEESKWPRSRDEIAKFRTESKAAAPEKLRFVLDELSDGDKAVAAVWHVEVFGQKSPRGVTFYELDEAGQVKYVREAYNLSF
eukprot:TRINITY_DN11993_c0_g1_i1.p1 TRINITY_DN11993_c0_g1~~TRINITY_DN11993_c0_g1_i1.p1  ORF type:complete len:453 (-),score=96.00 TRINITY_DN11993_c0_g1_i1:141-1499(-)